MSTPTDPEVIPVQPTLQEVAKKRGWQALAQSLLIDVVVAVALSVITMVGAIDTPEALALAALSLVKTVIVAAAQWAVRRFVDRSGYNEDGTAKV